MRGQTGAFRASLPTWGKETDREVRRSAAATASPDDAATSRYLHATALGVLGDVL